MTTPSTHGDEAITLERVQATVDAWISQWDAGYWPPLSNLARLTEEVGELARALNHVYGSKKKKDTEATQAIEEELADVLFVVATLANSLDIDLTQAFAKTMQKLEIRDATRWKPKA